MTIKKSNAFMIICHKNARQIVKLIEKCCSLDSDVFIHVDSLINNKEFMIIKNYIEKKDGNIYMIDKRIHGSLDDRSLVDITLQLIKKAQQIQLIENKHYQYYALLSGQDYLIKSLAQIEKEMNSLYPIPLIDCTPYDKKNWLYHKFSSNKTLIKYIKKIHCKENKLLANFEDALIILIRKICKIFNRTAYHYLHSMNISLYGGSAWWILPDIVITYIIDEVNKKKDYLDILLNDVYTPEETFFQIMTMQSPLAYLVEVNDIKCRSQNCKTFAYFSDNNKNFIGHPYIITMDSLELIKNSNCWIARKFDINVDAAIFAEIDRINSISDIKT